MTESVTAACVRRAAGAGLGLAAALLLSSGCGEHEGPGVIQGEALPAEAVQARVARQAVATDGIFRGVGYDQRPRKPVDDPDHGDQPEHRGGDEPAARLRLEAEPREPRDERHPRQPAGVERRQREHVQRARRRRKPEHERSASDGASERAGHAARLPEACRAGNSAAPPRTA